MSVSWTAAICSADLWALGEGIRERLDAPLLDSSGLEGLADALHLLHQSYVSSPPDAVASLITEMLALCRVVPNDTTPDALERLIRAWRAARPFAEQLRKAVTTQEEGIKAGDKGRGTQAQAGEQHPEEADTEQDTEADSILPPSSPSASYWAEKIQQQIEAWNQFIDRYFAWVEALSEAPTDLLIHARAGRARVAARGRRRRSLPAHAGQRSYRRPGRAYDRLQSSGQRALWVRPNAGGWQRLEEAHSQAQWFAGEKLAQAQETLDKTQTFADAMNLRFLYDAERRAFSIGYNVEDRRLDNFFYDLLASEARLGSFVAVARGEVPVEHWFALGRPFASAYGQRALLSWSGTMFEYLMPLLLTRHYENSLLDQGCRAASRVPDRVRQAARHSLGHFRGRVQRARHPADLSVPGVRRPRPGTEARPGKRPCRRALCHRPGPAAYARRGRAEPADAGPSRACAATTASYESIDYTRQSDEGGDPGVIVKTYMAHHQGMSLLAIDNLLHDNIMQARFHSDPRVRATESLLYERVPANPPIAKDYAAQVARSRASPPRRKPPRLSAFPRPTRPRLARLLLANAEYSVMITNRAAASANGKIWKSRAGGPTPRGTTPAPLSTSRIWTMATFWSATAQPVGGTPRNYMAVFTPEKAEFTRRDGPIETRTEIVVSPEDNVEVRRITFVNHSNVEHRLELTSYVEIALAAHAADRAHPAFSKLFVQTEALPQHDALLASRRPRASGDPTPWAVHVVSVPQDIQLKDKALRENASSSALFETDRAKFLGRGRYARASRRDGRRTERQCRGRAGPDLQPAAAHPDSPPMGAWRSSSSRAQATAGIPLSRWRRNTASCRPRTGPWNSPGRMLNSTCGICAFSRTRPCAISNWLPTCSIQARVCAPAKSA